jgi:hypothetical protein
MPTERILIATPQAGGGARIVASPFQFLVTGEDNLRVRAWNSSDGSPYAITGRIRLDDGTLQVFTHTITPTSDRAANEYLFPLGTGFVLNVTVESLDATVARGECYVSLELVRGFSGAIATLGTLAANYVAGALPLAWPGTAVENPLEGRGAYSVIPGAPPGPGAQLSYTVPAHARWHLHQLYCRLTANGVVGVRRAILQGSDAAAQQRWVSVAPYQQNALEVVDYTWMPGMAHETTLLPGTTTAGLPWPHELIPGSILQTFVAGGTGGDAWGAPILCIEEWIDIWR